MNPPLSRVVVSLLLGAATLASMSACGSSQNSTDATTSTAVATPPPPDESTGSEPSNAEASTTTSPEASTTTAEPPASQPSITARWTEVDLDAMSAKASPPCCADTWHGAVSPTLAPADEPLIDGPYFVRMEWPDDLTQPLRLELARFERCAVLPEGSCEANPRDEPYDVDQLGVDLSQTRLLELGLDASVRVVVLSARPSDRAEGAWEPTAMEATGEELATLATDVERAYDREFGDPLSSGDDAATIIADMTAQPSGGFVPFGYDGFFFMTLGQPPLLFQAIFPHSDGEPTPGRGTDVLAISSIEVLAGQTTINVYSGFYS